jgi:hypothetical protein
MASALHHGPKGPCFSASSDKIIPIIFCIEADVYDTDDNNADKTKILKKHKTKTVAITSKESPHNERITAAELRRAYKLCYELGNKEIQDVAQQTFKFVKVI